MNRKAVFIYMYAFDATGGIEKYNRAFIKAMDQSCPEFQAISVYDSTVDERYISSKKVMNCKGNRVKFFKEILKISGKANMYFFGHIHLFWAGAIIKLLNPLSRVTFCIHGKEVWNTFSLFKRQILKRFSILSVSQYSLSVYLSKNNLKSISSFILPNCIDPFFNVPINCEKPNYLIKRYNISNDAKVCLALTRISKRDRQKNYLNVIDCIGSIMKKNAQIVFILAGKCEGDEFLFLQNYIVSKGLEKNILMPGYISESELVDHYLLADVFILPSEKEGFGIAFIEALVCKLKIIAGNIDGSVEELRGSEFGYFINPAEKGAIENALWRAINEPKSMSERVNVSGKVQELYSFSAFTKRIETILQK